MPGSGSVSCKRVLLLCSIAGALSMAFVSYTDKQKAVDWTDQCLKRIYDASGEPKLKRCELTVTPDAFLRSRKTYQNGKQEFFSFSLHSFADMDYWGNTSKGVICIRTKADDIIVQTYNDPKGNIDSMTTMIRIPVKGVDAERADSLFNSLQYLKAQP
jgi:hypothetical protein